MCPLFTTSGNMGLCGIVRFGSLVRWARLRLTRVANHAGSRRSRRRARGVVVVGTWVLGLLGQGAGAAIAAPREPVAVIGSLGGALAGLAGTGEGLVIGQGSRLVVLSRETHIGLQVASELPIGESIRGIIAVDEQAVAVWTSSRVVVVDLARIESPLTVGVYEDGSEVMSVAGRDGRCYVLEADSLVVLRMERPSTIVREGSVSLPLRAKRTTLAVAGEGVVFVGRHIGSIIAVDVTSPLAPVIVGGVEGPIAPLSMAAAGRSVYYLDASLHYDRSGAALRGTWLGRLSIGQDGSVEETTPIELVTPGRIAFAGALVTAVDATVAVYGHRLTSSTEEVPELRLWRTDAWPAPQESAVIGMPRGTGDVLTACGRSLCLGGNGVSLADGGRLSPQVTVVDLGSGTLPALSDFWASTDVGRVSATAAVGGDVALAEEMGHLAIFDVRAPTGLSRIGSIPAEETGFGVVSVSASDSLLAALTSRLTAFDVRDRANPVKVVDSQVPGDVLPVLAFDGSRLVHAEGTLWGGPDPEPGYSLVVFHSRGGVGAVLRREVEFPVGGYVSGVALSGSIAYAAVRPELDGNEVLAVYDVSALESPALVGFVDLPEDIIPKALTIRGGIAYIMGRVAADGRAMGSALQVVDIASSPLGRLRGAVRLARRPGFAEPVLTGQRYALALLGPYAVVAGHEAMVRVVALADADRPMAVQDIPMADLVVGVAVVDELAYVVLANGEVQVLRCLDCGGSGVRRQLSLPLVVTR